MDIIYVTCGAFATKMYRVGTDYEKICSDCVQHDQPKSKPKPVKCENEVTTSGHIILERGPGKKVKYQCGNCGSINELANIQNLRRSTNTGKCFNCRYNSSKLDLAFISREVRKYNLKPEFEQSEYQNNKQILPFSCIRCNESIVASMSNLRRGKYRKCGCDNRVKSAPKNHPVKSNKNQQKYQYHENKVNNYTEQLKKIKRKLDFHVLKRDKYGQKLNKE